MWKSSQENIADVIIYSRASSIHSTQVGKESLLPTYRFYFFRFLGAKNGISLFFAEKTVCFLRFGCKKPCKRRQGRGVISAAGLDATLRLLKPQDVEQCAGVCVVKWGKVAIKA